MNHPRRGRTFHLSPFSHVLNNNSSLYCSSTDLTQTLNNSHIDFFLVCFSLIVSG